jgi:hypothetical protein
MRNLKKQVKDSPPEVLVIAASRGANQFALSLIGHLCVHIEV